MRPLLLIISFLLSQQTYSQKFEIINGDTVNRIDKKGLKQGKWVEVYGTNRRSEYFFINNKKEGEYRWYDEDNNISEIGYYKNGQDVGKTSEFEKGKLCRSRVYKNGRQMPLVYYYDNGQPKNGGTYFWGNGTVLHYDSLGFILNKKTYKNYKLNGDFEEYFTNKQLKEKGIYKDNKYWTIDVRFDSTGEKIDFGTIKSGNGLVYTFNDSTSKSEEYKQGRLWNVFWYRIHEKSYESIGTFKNGNGIIKEYNSVGELVSELSYKNGLLNGTCRYYQGKVFMVGECVNGNREGKWLIYQNGRIRNVEDYKNDRSVGLSCF